MNNDFPWICNPSNLIIYELESERLLTLAHVLKILEMRVMELIILKCLSSALSKTILAHHKDNVTFAI